MVRAHMGHPPAKRAGLEGPAGLVNAPRGHRAELGIVVGRGIRNVGKLVEEVREAGDDRVPPIARGVMSVIVDQPSERQERIRKLEADLPIRHRGNEAGRRPAAMTGIGPLTATALVATVTHALRFRSARELAARIGRVPRRHSSGGKERLGGISKRGDAHLRRLLIHGARTALRWRRTPAVERSGWVRARRDRRPPNVATVAIANETARIAPPAALPPAALPTDRPPCGRSAVWARGVPYRSPAPAQAA